MRAMLSRIFLIAVCYSLLAREAAAQQTTYLQLSPTVKAVLYSPAHTGASRIAVLNMHEDANVLEDISCTELVKRGFYALCMNGRSDNNESVDFWNDLPFDVATGMKYLKDTVKATKILLYAGSGGGPLMTFYQNVAQNGPSVCQGKQKLIPCSSDLAGLPPADGIIMRDAHPGTAVNTLRALNPAVDRDAQPWRINGALDPFNPNNGFNPSGWSQYSADFKRRYFKAQAARMNRLVDAALAKLRAMDAGKYPYVDDDAFVIHGADGARLTQMDISIDGGTLKPQKLLKNDRTTVTEIVKSVRVTAQDSAQRMRSFYDSAKLLTVKSFLGTRAIRALESYDGIDYCSNNNSTPCHLKRITVPILILGMSGHYFLRDN